MAYLKSIKKHINNRRMPVKGILWPKQFRPKKKHKIFVIPQNVKKLLFLVMSLMVHFLQDMACACRSTKITEEKKQK